jgi:hypothetical protein
MSGSYDQKSNYKCVSSEIITRSTDDNTYDLATGKFVLPLKYNKEVDKIRITPAYHIIHNNVLDLPTFVVNSTILDKPLLTVGAYYLGSVGGNHLYARDLNTAKGQEIVFYNKIIPNGEYQCKLTRLNGAPTGVVGILTMYFYVEYFKNY